jgi:hypothetical protein
MVRIPFPALPDLVKSPRLGSTPRHTDWPLVVMWLWLWLSSKRLKCFFFRILLAAFLLSLLVRLSLYTQFAVIVVSLGISWSLTLSIGLLAVLCPQPGVETWRYFYWGSGQCSMSSLLVLVSDIVVAVVGVKYLWCTLSEIVYYWVNSVRADHWYPDPRMSRVPKSCLWTFDTSPWTVHVPFARPLRTQNLNTETICFMPLWE